MRTVSFKTIGCRLNQAETAQMAASFEAAGYAVVPFGKECDVCVVHTCAVTNKAERTCARFARIARKHSPKATVVLAGCAVETGGEDLGEDSGADIIIGQADKLQLPDILAKQKPAAAPPRIPAFDTKRAIIKVQDGCDFRCAYCIVPFTRQRKYSRSIADIIEEIRQVAGRGYKEFVITGANLGRFEDGSSGLVSLLERIESVPGVMRIRLSSIELSTVEKEIITFMAGSRKLCRFLHVPLQSGDDRVLAAMGRRYTTRQFRELVEFACDKIPLIGLGTDIIAGLPGEDDKAFENSVKLLEELPFTNIHVFPFSKRKGTRAAAMPDQIEAQEKKRRAGILMEIARCKRVTFATRSVGQRVSVLVEKTTRTTASGWTGEYLPAEIHAPGISINQVVDFTPASCTEDGVLVGKRVDGLYGYMDDSRVR
ncbi:MAG: tRNA (N(6)-L-threonylcarbamoyladenosine(37)-C(2))-methylthiotransferase MtaB [Verrucomicrobia bacterium]|nr:tRNA (N(6)-L-threonylcarbamoyladenosine(37)-C(2))-methylthiotransferase MtaB [Verrucomicrobiota bacterium]